MITFCYLSIVSANFEILDFKKSQLLPRCIYHQGCPMFTSFYSETKNLKKLSLFYVKENKSNNKKTKTMALSLSTSVKKPANKWVQLQAHQEGLENTNSLIKPSPVFRVEAIPFIFTLYPQIIQDDSLERFYFK